MRQLEHDSTEKAKDRTAALRREVYLTVAEELTKASSYLASLPQANLAETNPSQGTQGFFAAASKFVLIAEPQTALLMQKVVTAYGKLVMNMIVRLVPINRLRAEISNCGDGSKPELYRQYQHKTNEFLKWYLKEFTQITEETLPVIVAIRSDLGLTSDLDRFQLALRDQYSETLSQFDLLLETLSAEEKQ